jgi:hypothetical protein
MDNEYEDEIRAPDPVKQERLIDNTQTEFHYDLDTILELSKHEFNSTLEKEEQKAIELICIQSKEEQETLRKNKFNNIKIQLNKMILFDRTNLHYYELILSIIEMFELGVINEYKTNESECTNIFKILKTIRLPIDEIENFKKIIFCD